MLLQRAFSPPPRPLRFVGGGVLRRSLPTANADGPTNSIPTQHTTQYRTLCIVYCVVPHPDAAPSPPPPGSHSSGRRQILRALQAPVPLASLALPRVNHLLGPDDLALLALLPSLRHLEVAGVRVLQPSAVVVPGLTALAVRSERVELSQPLVALFPSLLRVELGHGAAEVPGTSTSTSGRPAATAGGVSGAGAGGAAGGADGAGGPAPVMAPAGPLLLLPPPQAAAGAGADGGGQQHDGAEGMAGGGGGGAPPGGLPPELFLHLRGLAGLSDLQALSIGGRPGHGVEALGSLTALSALVLRRCGEFRPLRKAVEELRSLPTLRSLELYACCGGDACGYEIARLLRRLQKLPNLARMVVDCCDPRLAQQLATAPLGRLSELQLLGLPELTPLDLRYVVQAQGSLRHLQVRSCAKLSRATVEGLPQAVNRPQLAVEWGP